MTVHSCDTHPTILFLTSIFNCVLINDRFSSTKSDYNIKCCTGNDLCRVM